MSHVKSTVLESGAKGIADAIRAVQKGHFQPGPGSFEKLLALLIQEKKATSTENFSILEKNYAQSMFD